MVQLVRTPTTGSTVSNKPRSNWMERTQARAMLVPACHSYSASQEGSQQANNSSEED